MVFGKKKTEDNKDQKLGNKVQVTEMKSLADSSNQPQELAKQELGLYMKGTVMDDSTAIQANRGTSVKSEGAAAPAEDQPYLPENMQELKRLIN